MMAPPAAPRGRRRTNLSFTSLSEAQRELEERVRTVCLVICAAGVCAYGLARLKFALVPLVLSLSLKYSLQPMIDAMTGHGVPPEDFEAAALDPWCCACAGSDAGGAYSPAVATEADASGSGDPHRPSEDGKLPWFARWRNRFAVLAVVLPRRRCPRALEGKLCPSARRGHNRGFFFLLGGRFSVFVVKFFQKTRRPRLPHSVAVVIALLVAFSFLATLAVVVAESVRDFSSRADAYASQVQLLIVQGFRWLEVVGIDERWRKPQTLEKVADKLELSSFVTSSVLGLGEGLLSLFSTTMLVLLFTLYLLLTPRSHAADDDNADDDDDDDFEDDDDDDDCEDDDDFEDDDNFEDDVKRDEDALEAARQDDVGGGKVQESPPPALALADDEGRVSYRPRRRPSSSTLFETQGGRRGQRRRRLQRQRQRQEGSFFSSKSEVPQSPSSSFGRRVDRQIHAYIKGKFALSLLVGVLTAAVLALLEVDLWLAFGVFSCFANFVPNLGAVVAVALPLPVLFFDPDSSTFTAFLALAALVVLHAVIGNVVEPILFGHSLKLHPVVCLVSMSIWHFLWGIPGLILAVPITAVCRIYLRALDHPLAAGVAGLLDGRSL